MQEAIPLLAAHPEKRKAIVLISDGKDETPGGAEAQRIEREKLVAAARAAGIVIHTIGIAATPEGQAFFGSLKEISRETEGLFLPAALQTGQISKENLALLVRVMQGAGAATVDVSSMATASPLTITVKTADNKTAQFKVAADKVAAAIPAPPAARKQAEAATKAQQDKQRLWLLLGGGGLLVVIIVGILVALGASRRKAAEELARRQAEEQALLEEERARSAAVVPPTPEPPVLAWLEMCDAQQTRHPIRIPTLKIGRGQHNDLVLRNDSVSGNHCVINRTREGGWTVTDLNSGNGVIVDGATVQQADLKHGTLIELGDLKMRFLARA